MLDNLPHNIGAEQNILGSMLLSKTAMNKALDELNYEMFYLDAHSKIFEAMSSLVKNGMPLDITTIVTELETRRLLGSIGGIEYLSEAITNVPSAANIDAYIKIVKEKALLRNLINKASKIIELSRAEENDIDDVVEEAERTIGEVSRSMSATDIKSINEVLNSAHARLEYLASLDTDIIGLRTSFTDIDRITSGLQGSQFIIIAARPAMGKTAFGVNMAINVARNTSKAVVFFNLEMSAEQLAFRMLASSGRIDSKKIVTGKLEENEWAKLGEAMSILSDTNIYIDDTAGATIGEIKRKCRKLAASEEGLGLVLIDYLQLLSSGNNKLMGQRQQEVSEISRSLKLLALELNVPIIAFSQLSRAVELRDDKRPMLSDLRESGSIEQDADIVAFLYRDDYYNPIFKRDDGISDSEFIIAKHRAGETDTVKLTFDKPVSLFIDKVE